MNCNLSQQTKQNEFYTQYLTLNQIIMEKVILLFFTLCVINGVMAQNRPPGGDGKIYQNGEYNKAMINQTGVVSDGYARINILGNTNDAYIHQAGSSQLAGGTSNINISHCRGFDATYLPNGTDLKVKLQGTSIDVACGNQVTVSDLKLALPYVEFGIDIVGNANISSIKQSNKENAAGIDVDANTSKTAINQHGKRNLGLIRVSDLAAEGSTTAIIKQSGDDNMAYAYSYKWAMQKGNTLLVVQDGRRNKAIQLAKSGNNQMATLQDGNANKASQFIVGMQNNALVNQAGNNNMALEAVEGHQNNSYVDQFGNSNSAYIFQGNYTSKLRFPGVAIVGGNVEM